MRLPITRERIRTHFHYAWWQYVLLVCLAIFGWNLLYTTTRYRSPESLKVEWYCQGVVAPQAQDKLDALMEPKRYIGRCPQQVAQFLAQCAPLLRQAQAADGDITV